MNVALGAMKTLLEFPFLFFYFRSCIIWLTLPCRRRGFGFTIKVRKKQTSNVGVPSPRLIRKADRRSQLRLYGRGQREAFGWKSFSQTGRRRLSVRISRASGGTPRIRLTVRSDQIGRIKPNLRERVS